MGHVGGWGGGVERPLLTHLGNKATVFQTARFTGVAVVVVLGGATDPSSY